MPGTIRCDSDSIFFELNPKIDNLDFGQRGVDIVLSEGLFFLSNFQQIIEEILIDGFGGFGHIHFFSVASLC